MAIVRRDRFGLAGGTGLLLLTGWPGIYHFQRAGFRVSRPHTKVDTGNPLPEPGDHGSGNSLANHIPSCHPERSLARSSRRQIIENPVLGR